MSDKSTVGSRHVGSPPASRIAFEDVPALTDDNGSDSDLESTGAASADGLPPAPQYTVDFDPDGLFPVYEADPTLPRNIESSNLLLQDICNEFGRVSEDKSTPMDRWLMDMSDKRLDRINLGGSGFQPNQREPVT